MSATESTDSTGGRTDPVPPHAPRRRLATFAGAAVLAGVLTGGATGLAGLAAWAVSAGSGGLEPDRTVLAELAGASGRLATTIALYAASGEAERDAAGSHLSGDAGRIAALLSRLPGDDAVNSATATMRRLLTGLDAEIEDLRRLIDRRDQEAQALDALTRRIRERHLSFERSLGPLSHDAALSGDGPTLTGVLDARFRLDDMADDLASHLYAALSATDMAGLAEHRSEVRRLADRLRHELERRRTDATSVRQMDAARRLMALGIDTDNVFERREAFAEVSESAMAAARSARDRADALGTLAQLGSDGYDSALREIAPTLLAAAITSGLVAALTLATALRLAGTVPPPGPPPDTRGVCMPTGSRPALHIVVADDERLNRLVAAALLGRNGHKVTAVEDGVEAVAAVERGPVDLVLMDLRMPRLDGIGATRRIRALPDRGRARTPIVVLTASAIPGDAEEAEAAGADAVLPKPLRWDTLEPLLHRLFGDGPTPPPTAVEPAPAEPPAFDEAAIRQMRELLPSDRVAALIGTTHTTLAGHHRALNAAWAAGNRADVSALAHRIAGVSGVYGCTALRTAAQTLERAIDGGVADPSGLIRELDRRTGPALAYLRSLLTDEAERG